MKNRAHVVSQLWVCLQQQLSELTANPRVPRSSVGRGMAFSKGLEIFSLLFKRQDKNTYRYKER